MYAGTLSAAATCVPYMQAGDIRKHGKKRMTGNSKVRLGESTGCTNLVVLTYEHVHKNKVSDWCRVAAVSVYHFLDCDRIRRKRPILGSIS